MKSNIKQEITTQETKQLWYIYIYIYIYDEIINKLISNMIGDWINKCVCPHELNSVGMTLHKICKVWVRSPATTKKIIINVFNLNNIVEN